MVGLFSSGAQRVVCIFTATYPNNNYKQNNKTTRLGPFVHRLTNARITSHKNFYTYLTSVAPQTPLFSYTPHLGVFVAGIANILLTLHIEHA